MYCVTITIKVFAKRKFASKWHNIN